MTRKRLPALLLLLILLLTGCAAKEAKPAPSCAEAARKVQESANFQELTEMTKAYIAKHLFVEEALLKDACMLRDATMATPEFILIAEAANEKDAALLKQAAQEYLDEMLPQYRDYQPEEMPKLESAKVLTKGNRVALIVSPDAAKTTAALESAW